MDLFTENILKIQREQNKNKKHVYDDKGFTITSIKQK